MQLIKPVKQESGRISAEVSAYITLNGLSADEIVDVKEQLTFQNPEYLNVKRYSKWQYTRVPEFVTYYDVSGNSVLVPRGFKHSAVNRAENKTVMVQVPYPKFCLELRDTQREAAEAYFKHNQTLDLNGIIQLPTGKGKTILGMYLACATQQRTLVIVHKDDLVTGWKNDVELCFGGKVKCGLIKAKKRDIGQQITIATIQTLNRLSTEELNNLTTKFGMIILDEMHHCPSSSYSVLQRFPARYLLGLTATPERADGLTHVMSLYFGGFAYRYKQPKGKKDEDILPVRVIKRECPVMCEPVCVKTTSNSGEKYQVIYFHTSKDKKLSESEIKLSDVPYTKRPKVSYLSLDDYVVRNEQYLTQVCADICFEYKNKRSIVVFFTQKEHINIYFDRLIQTLGVDNVTKFYGDCKTNDLSLKIAEEKKPHVTLATYAKGTEGTNVKQWEVAFLVSSINNEKNTEQVAGRIRRIKEGKINPVIIYDYAHPYVYSLRNHYETRKRRYKQLGFELPPEETAKRGLFQRGFQK